jgi:hypothetical protein
MRDHSRLRVPLDHPDAGHRFLVLTRKTGQPFYETTVVEKSDDHGASNYFLRKVPISEFFSESRKRNFWCGQPKPSCWWIQQNRSTKRLRVSHLAKIDSGIAPRTTMRTPCVLGSAY